MWSDLRRDAVGSDLNVLIVEDEMVARNALASLLAGIGYATRAVGSAELARERIKEGDRPEIALVDLDLPGMNGADFIARLTVEQPQTFAILITAASNDRVAALRDAGIPHLRKPLDFKELVNVLHAHSRIQ